MNPAPKPIVSLLFFLFGCMPLAMAQLCTGSLGDPVVKITFGSGINPGPPLPASTTNYQFVSSQCPSDGSYTITNLTAGCFTDTWQTVHDHTGNPNGYFMLVNASIQPNDFYLDTVKGLCPNTTYEFAAWILNMLVPSACGGQGILPNITFRIETTGGTVLKSYNTGDIAMTNSGTWVQYVLFLSTPANISDVVLRMTNNAPGGCGNDLALDDITFRPCGPLVTASVSGNGGLTTVGFCQGDPRVLNFNSSVSSGYLAPAFQWQLSTDSGASWSDIPGAINGSYVRQPTSPGNYQYRMTVAESGNIGLTNCRVASNPIRVSVNPNPVTSAINSGPVCEGFPLRLQATGGSTYSWSGPNGFVASGSSDTLTRTTVQASGKYTVVVTSQAACSHTDSTSVLVYPNPSSQFNSSAPACQNNTINFTDQSKSYSEVLVKWRWDFGDGDRALSQNPSHIYAASGTYPVSLQVQNDKGCLSGIQTEQLTIHPLPRTYFGTPKVCLSDPFAAFTDSSTIADNSQGTFSWLWDFGDPGAGPGDPNVSTSQNPQHRYRAVGVYLVHLTVTSASGCSSDTTLSFTVNGAVPKAHFTIDRADSLCSNGPVVITDSSTVDFGNITRVEIYWDYANSPALFITDPNPAPGKKYSHLYPDFGGPSARTYQIRYVAYSGINCVSEVSSDITLQPSPQLLFGNIPPVCQGAAAFQITQATEGSGLAGTGTFSGTGLSLEGLFDPAMVSPGTDSLSFRFTTTQGCTASIGQEILIYPKPTATASPEITVLEGGSVLLDGSGSGNNLRFLWVPDSDMDNNHIAMPRVSPSGDILYTLIVTSGDGCVDSTQVKVTVLKKPVVPNAFSPNGDGINDTWVIKYLDSYPGAEVSVFNRYGQMVFHSLGYTRAWDGTLNGNPLPVATYYWIINPKNGRAQMNGSVTILR